MTSYCAPRRITRVPICLSAVIGCCVDLDLAFIIKYRTEIPPTAPEDDCLLAAHSLCPVYTTKMAQRKKKLTKKKKNMGHREAEADSDGGDFELAAEIKDDSVVSDWAHTFKLILFGGRYF